MRNFQRSFARTKLSTFPDPSCFSRNDESGIEDTKYQSKQNNTDRDDAYSSELSISSSNTIRSEPNLKSAVRPNRSVSRQSLLSELIIFVKPDLLSRKKQLPFPGLPTSNRNSSSNL